MRRPAPLDHEAVQHQIRAARLHGVLAAVDYDGSEGPATAALRSVVLLHVPDPGFRPDGTDMESPPVTMRGRGWHRHYLRRFARYRTYHERGLL